MALQGTLDTFALSDVLRLLATTKKSGRLELNGAPGTGSVWFGDGQLVGGRAPDAARAEGLPDVLVQLLRFEDGSFQFEPGDLPETPAGPFELDNVMTDAEARLAEWRDIETVVPSLQSRLTLDSSAPTEDVTLAPEDWQIVAGIGSGLAVSELGQRLSSPDLALCRSVKALAERGLVAVSWDEQEQLDVLTASYAGDQGDASALLPEPLPASDENNGRALSSVESEEDDSTEDGEQAYVAPATADQADMASQLSALSPKAAEAIAVAASSLSTEDGPSNGRRLRSRTSVAKFR